MKKINKEYLIVIVLMLIYSVISFSNLGSLKAPKTYFEFKADNEAIINLSDKHKISKIRCYTGNNFGEFTIMQSLDGKTYEDLVDMKTNSVFSWEDTNLNATTKYLKIIPKYPNQVLGDIQIYDEYNQKITTMSGNKESSVLVDELSTVPDEISYLNSTYFDEIYFARSAYEYVHNISNYEWTHPPMGKLIIAIPTLLFGFSPLTYRIMNNLAGLLMIPVMYMLAKRLFKNEKSAFLAAILITFDNFHLAQSRLATVDSILVLFSLLSILFMLFSFDKNNSPKKQIKYLLLSGLFIGLAIATKWTGLYVGLGLAIIFFINLYNQNKKELKNIFKLNSLNLLIFINTLITIPVSIYYLMLLFSRNTAKTFITIYFAIFIIALIAYIYKHLLKEKYLFRLSIVCIISFIILPISIYILSYLIFPNVGNYDGSLTGVINQIKVMYNYHANLEATHPFTSKWYEWPIMYKPVWYYSGGANTIKSTIVGIGNPIIWWSSIPAILYSFYSLIKKHDKNDLFIIIFFLATYIPYVFVGRIMFMYHYYIVLPFAMLAIVSSFNKIAKKDKDNIFCSSYIAIVIAIFIIFYPVTTGKQVSNEYVEALKWLNSWVF